MAEDWRHELLRKYIKDRETLDHSLAVAQLAKRVCAVLGFNDEYYDEFEAGLWHDLGKSKGIDDKHPQHSYDIIMEELGDKGWQDVAEIARRHHQFQQYPYPDPASLPMVRDRVQRVAEVIAICDKFEAYKTRGGRGPKGAIEGCLEEYDFDTEIVGALCKVALAGRMYG